MSDFKFEFDSFIDTGNTTVVEMEVTATMSWEMEMPDGSAIPQTANSHILKGRLIVETENGKIKNQKMYADLLSLMQGFYIIPP